ncbi:hypothetical protein [Bradyrhizobium murdochi]|uniref:hypothetical protein n=1 Tax=Bradyrhizobium murdochi TaxID=1038859 RepID=UPI000552F7A5|nr:hypothetical protein [Bradyrhizobium murdochi]
MFTAVLPISHPLIDFFHDREGRGDMLSDEWESMTIDELFELREMMQDVLSERLKARKAEIERKLQMLNQPSNDVGQTKSRDQ